MVTPELGSGYYLHSFYVTSVCYSSFGYDYSRWKSVYSRLEVIRYFTLGYDDPKTDLLEFLEIAWMGPYMVGTIDLL